MSRVAYIILFVLVIVTGVLSYYVFAKPDWVSVKQSSTKVTRASSQNVKEPLVSDTQITFPLNQFNSAVRSVFVVYVLHATITDIRPPLTGSGLELITDISGDGIPLFILTSNTVVVGPSGELQKVTYLAKNQVVDITVAYNIRAKRWNVGRVVVNPGTTKITPINSPTVSK